MVAKARYEIVAQDKTERAANSVRRRLGGIRESVFSVRSAFAGLAGVFATGALARGISNTVNNLEAINRQAESLGATRERIQELTFTFRQYKLEQDDVSDALGTLSDRAQDAKDGVKSFQDDFALLNISVEDLRNKRPGELFELVASRVAQIEDPTRRTAAVVRIFGDDLGRQLLPLLKQGATGLRNYAEEAHNAGAVMGDELVKDGAEAAKTFRELREVIDAQFTRAVANNADELERLAEATISAGGAASRWGSELVSFVEDLAETAAAGVTGDYTQSLSVLENRIQGLRIAIEDTQDSGLEQWWRGLWGFESVEEMKARLDQLERLRDALRADQMSPTETVNIMNRLAGGPDRGRARATPEDTGFEGRRTTAIRLQHMRGRDRMAYADALAEIREEADKTRDRVVPMWNEIADSERRVNQMTDELGFTFESAFEDAIVKGNDLRGVLAGLAEDIQRIILRQTVTKPAGNALANIVGGLFGGMTGGGMMADPTPGTAGRAMGGPVTAGQGYLVGERGPELFRPNRSGDIVPNDRIGRGDTYTVNNNIDARGADPAAIARLERVVDQLNRSVEPRAIRAVSEERART